ncbi:hypothetical protein PoB_003567500 [Plakobranchus ocellatus]|uniref:Uncharacterized protein n=1 Tax=Plakobranchus ocellatus TaxID=259542 RepID=A0AAV4AP91_9GAST|nr:hypothetical protein PoB_003567500 [Plakobranchus ocellatus]
MLPATGAGSPVPDVSDTCQTGSNISHERTSPLGSVSPLRGRDFLPVARDSGAETGVSLPCQEGSGVHSPESSGEVHTKKVASDKDADDVLAIFDPLGFYNNDGHFDDQIRACNNPFIENSNHCGASENTFEGNIGGLESSSQNGKIAVPNTLTSEERLSAQNHISQNSSNSTIAAHAGSSNSNSTIAAHAGSSNSNSISASGSTANSTTEELRRFLVSTYDTLSREVVNFLDTGQSQKVWEYEPPDVLKKVGNTNSCWHGINVH